MSVLKDRIKEAQKELNAYPGWVVDNSIFQGGQPSEYRSVEPVNNDKANKARGNKSALQKTNI